MGTTPWQTALHKEVELCKSDPTAYLRHTLDALARVCESPAEATTQDTASPGLEQRSIKPIAQEKPAELQALRELITDIRQQLENPSFTAELSGVPEASATPSTHPGKDDQVTSAPALEDPRQILCLQKDGSTTTWVKKPNTHFAPLDAAQASKFKATIEELLDNLVSLERGNAPSAPSDWSYSSPAHKTRYQDVETKFDNFPGTDFLPPNTHSPLTFNHQIGVKIRELTKSLKQAPIHQRAKLFGTLYSEIRKSSVVDEALTLYHGALVSLCWFADDPTTCPFTIAQQLFDSPDRQERCIAVIAQKLPEDILAYVLNNLSSTVQRCQLIATVRLCDPQGVTTLPGRLAAYYQSLGADHLEALLDLHVADLVGFEKIEDTLGGSYSVSASEIKKTIDASLAFFDALEALDSADKRSLERFISHPAVTDRPSWQEAVCCALVERGRLTAAIPVLRQAGIMPKSFSGSLVYFDEKAWLKVLSRPYGSSYSVTPYEALYHFLRELIMPEPNSRQDILIGSTFWEKTNLCLHRLVLGMQDHSAVERMKRMKRIKEGMERMIRKMMEMERKMSKKERMIEMMIEGMKRMESIERIESMVRIESMERMESIERIERMMEGIERRMEGIERMMEGRRMESTERMMMESTESMEMMMMESMESMEMMMMEMMERMKYSVSDPYAWALHTLLVGEGARIERAKKLSGQADSASPAGAGSYQFQLCWLLSADLASWLPESSPHTLEPHERIAVLTFVTKAGLAQQVGAELLSTALRDAGVYGRRFSIPAPSALAKALLTLDNKAQRLSIIDDSLQFLYRSLELDGYAWAIEKLIPETFPNEADVAKAKAYLSQGKENLIKGQKA